MATSQVKYQGNLRTKAIHLASKNQIITDAPIDNNGKGEAFSPTDLVATALASCLTTIMGIAAKNHGISFEKCESTVTKVMGTEPRRIIEIIVQVKLAEGYTNKEQKILENAAITCPVSKSLHPELKQTINFIYDL